MLHRGIFCQWRRTINMMEYFVSGVALSMLHRGIFWLSILDRGKFQKWYNKCYIAEYFVNGVALPILDRGKFRKWHNKCYIAEYFINVVAVWIWQNISSVASHYLCCVVQFFDVALSILNREKFQKWHNVTSWNFISSMALHYQYDGIFHQWRRTTSYIAEYLNVALSILDRGKFQKYNA